MYCLYTILFKLYGFKKSEHHPGTLHLLLEKALVLFQLNKVQLYYISWKYNLIIMD